MVDAADATSSGASGDSNVILRALIEADYQGRALIPIAPMRLPLKRHSNWASARRST